MKILQKITSLGRRSPLHHCAVGHLPRAKRLGLSLRWFSMGCLIYSEIPYVYPQVYPRFFTKPENSTKRHLMRLEEEASIPLWASLRPLEIKAETFLREHQNSPERRPKRTFHQKHKDWKSNAWLLQAFPKILVILDCLSFKKNKSSSYRLEKCQKTAGWTKKSVWVHHPVISRPKNPT